MSWRKPIEFGLSGGVTALTLAWVLGRFPRSSIVDWMIAIGVAFFVPETILIDLQQWRGVPSHFNVRTPFDAAIFDAMAVAIGVVGLAILLATARSLGRVNGGPATALAIRLGLLFLLIGQVLGGLIIANYFSTDVPIENASIVGASGQLKVPHALALHGVQVLAILAVMLERTRMSTRAAAIAVASCAMGYGLLLAAATLQTYSGLGPLAFSPLALLASLVGVTLVGGPYLRGVSALLRPSLA